MAYKIDPNKCIACGSCAGVCPVMAIAAAGGKYAIDPHKCISCGTCVGLCPVMAIGQ